MVDQSITWPWLVPVQKCFVTQFPIPCTRTRTGIKKNNIDSIILYAVNYLQTKKPRIIKRNALSQGLFTLTKYPPPPDFVLKGPSLILKVTKVPCYHHTNWSDMHTNAVYLAHYR